MTTRLAAAALLVVCGACERGAPVAQRASTNTATATTPAPAAAPVAPAESLYFAAEYDSAAALWKRELDAATQSNDSLRQATVLMWLGLTAWRQGDNVTARTLGERALEMKKRLAGKTDLSRSYNALGLVARDDARLRDAAALFENAVATAKAAADTPGVSRAAANIALIQLELGDFDKARQGFEAAREAGRAVGDERVEGNALNNLGMLTIRLGDPAGAIPLINSARERYKSIEYATGEQNALDQLATAYELLGEPQRALSLLDSAGEIARAGNMRPEVASNMRLTGQVYQTMEDHRRALPLLTRSVALTRELGLRHEEALTLRTEAVSHAALGRVDLARERTLAALRIHRKEGAIWEELGDLTMLAELATIAKDNADASAHLAAARALARRLNSPRARVEVALSAGRIAARNSDWPGVIRALDGVDPDVEKARADIAWEHSSLRARAFARTGRLDSALVSGRKAIASAERVRGRIPSAGLRTGFTSARSAIYADQVIALLQTGRAAEAFAVADAARGRALVEHLSQAREGIARSSRTTRDITRGEALLRQINELITLLEDVQRTPKEERSLDDRAIGGISARIAVAEREYATLIDAAATHDPQRAMLLGTKRIAANDVQRLLRSDETLVEYLVADDRLLAFVLSARGVRHIEIPVGDSALSLRVRLVREMLGQRASDNAAVSAALGNLHRLLVQPLERAGLLAGMRRLIVVPHSSLSYLPFSALRSERGRYLAQDYALLTLPSAGAFVSLRTNRPEDGSQRKSASSVVFAPFTSALPATRSEARSVQAAVGGTKTLLDREASERAFRQAAGENRVLHVATHGTLNVRNPLFSRIDLAREADTVAGSGNDGRLTVHELIAMRMGSPLVFLSGCETALGSAWSTDFTRGEDYATLSQALLYSGARSSVATLWRINDESAAVFAKHFYRELKRRPPAEALARAQQLMLIDDRYGNPYHWAAYQVAGSGDRIALKERWWGLFAR